METVDERSGWWMASDGNWYPPELAPPDRRRPGGGTALSAAIRPMGPHSTFRRLHRQGRCINCGGVVRMGEDGWFDPDIDMVMCASCWPALVVARTTDPVVEVPEPPTGNPPAVPAGSPGASGADRPVSHAGTGSGRARRRDPRWRGGTSGHYLTSLRLHRELDDRAVVLDDRRVPGARGTIAHVVVASSGLWIADAKRMKGLIEYRPVSGSPAGGHLLVGGQDRTSLVDDLWERILAVTNLVTDPSVPVHPALVFVEGNWGSPTGILTKRPLRHQGVWILWPGALIKLIEEPGPLSPEAVGAIGSALDRALPPA